MKCPKCRSDLGQIEKYGIVIDYCPDCGTVVLDKGEIEKILKAYRDELNALRMNDNVPFSSSSVPQSVYYDDDDDYEHHPHKHYQQPYQGNMQQHNQHYNPNHPHHKKKEGFLDDIFDIF